MRYVQTHRHRTTTVTLRRMRRRLNINGDDASGYRLDTLATHCKHPTPVVGETMTPADYVNKCASVLQTTNIHQKVLCTRACEYSMAKPAS